LNVRQRMQSGRLKVFASLSKYLEECRLYRRNERGQIISGKDQLQDATRCLVSGISQMRSKPRPSFAQPSDFYGEHSWMAS
jgi:hypothetical protein